MHTILVAIVVFPLVRHACEKLRLCAVSRLWPSLEKSFVETKQDPVTYARSAIPCLAKDHLTYTVCGVRSSLVKRGRAEKVNNGDEQVL